MWSVRDITSSTLKRLPDGKASFRLREDRRIVVSVEQENEEDAERHIFPFNINHSSLIKHVPNAATVNVQDLVFLSYMMYLFTLRLMFNRRIKKFSKLDRELVDASRESLFSSFDLVRYKIATIKCLMRGYNPANHFGEIGDVFEECELSREDRVLYSLAYYNGDLTNFMVLLAGCPKDKFVVECETLRKEINTQSFYKEVRNASSFFASRKLSFIARGNRYSTSDLQHDLMMRAIQAYYWVRPFYSVLHAQNYAKRAIQGWTGCLITHYTDSSRERTRSDGMGGYENTLVEMTDDVTAYDGMLEDHIIHLIDIKRMLNKPFMPLEDLEQRILG